MDCENCKITQRTGPEPVPYIAHEAEMARLERTNKRVTILAALEAVALVLVVLFLH